MGEGNTEKGGSHTRPQSFLDDPNIEPLMLSAAQPMTSWSPVPALLSTRVPREQFPTCRVRRDHGEGEWGWRWINRIDISRGFVFQVGVFIVSTGCEVPPQAWRESHIPSRVVIILDILHMHSTHHVGERGACRKRSLHADN